MEFLRVVQDLYDGFGSVADYKKFVNYLPFLTSLPLVLPVLRIREIEQIPYLMQIVLDLLYAPWCAVLDQVLHGMECLVDAAPLLGARVQLLPEMTHDLGVVIPKRVRISMTSVKKCGDERRDWGLPVERVVG